MNHTTEEKRNRLFILLAALFLTNAIVAELIGVKIFSGESAVGLPPAHLNMLGHITDFNLTAGALIWPIVFITSDLINEYFGKPGIKRISYLAAFFIAYSFIVIFVTIKLPPAQFWLDANSKDPAGNYFNMDFAFNKILGQGQRIIIGSLAAFLIGQLVDVYVFQRLRKLTGPKMLWLRATGSTLVSQFIDSFVVLYIAFSGLYSNQQIIATGLTTYIYKFSVAILLTPVIYFGHSLIDRYLGKAEADQLADEAAKKSGSFL
jgi:uncharacterized integral membrane protein (TIGR00697 family)